MTKAKKLNAAMLFVALVTLGMGCELLTTVDRSQIGETGGGGEAGQGGTGATTTTTTSLGGGGTGGTGGTVSTGGSGGTGGAPCVPVDDNNECTDDVCNPDGTTAHDNKAAGVACTTGGSQCDGNGECVECLAPSDCPGQDDACQTRACTAGACGFDFVPAGTAVPAQTAGDCKAKVCDGSGAIADQNDDADLPDDANACTDDVCTAGVATNPVKALGTSCGTAGNGDPLLCDGAGMCVGCNAPTDCSGSDDECKVRTCVNKVCGVDFTAAGTAVAAQTDGDCLQQECDGAGVIVASNDDDDVPADDNNACTDDSCSGGAPVHPNKANGSVCNDGNACSQADTCQAGTCTGMSPVVCAAPDQCHDAGMCNPATGVCSNPIKANGSACNDGDACSQADTCQAGACTGANPVTCALPDQCHTAGMCNPATGVCSNPIKANGTSCSDGSACTQSDTCQAGTCTGANPVTCALPDQCHDAGTCNPATGTCSNPIKANGSACSDNNACTQTDTCQAGACTGASPVVCAAPDQCHTAGTCNTGTGVCSNPIKANGSACSDGNACTQSDTCQAGACTGASPVTCTAQDQCHDAGTCNSGTGVCSNPAKADGASCSDGNGCTVSDTCQAGACASGNPVTCTAQDQCHVVGTCNSGTGVCSNPNQVDGTVCMANGTPGACANGTCGTCGDGVVQAGELCDDGNFISGDGCDNNCTPTLCGNGILTAGEFCDDGNLANGDGCDANCTPTMCGNGIKTGAEACDDGNLVNGDGCDNNCSLTACGNGIKTGAEACDDGNATNGDGCDTNCTVSACGNGIKAGAEVCDDQNTTAGDGCSATCTLESGYTCAGTPSVCATTCGDGIRAGAEACDDANVANGDCCSATCQLEAANCEREPNNNKAQADVNGPVALSTLYKGAVTPIGDLDYYAFTLTGVSDVLLETYDGTGPYNCALIDTKVALLAPDGVTTLALDDDSGPGNCSLIDPNPTHTSSPNFTGGIIPLTAAQHLAPGTYYALVRHYVNPNGTAIIPAYTFRVSVLSTCGNGMIESTESCDDGNLVNGDGCNNICRIEATATEMELNNTCLTANGPYPLGAVGSYQLVAANINPVNEQDWFGFTLTKISDVKFETFDSTGPGGCAPTTVDTQIQVFKSDCVTAQTLVQDQGGIANCSKIDPALFSTVRQLPAGTYYVKVFPFSTTTTFGYNLQATVVASCGNGTLEGFEGCDDGNASNGDGCENNCTLTPVCGDGLLGGAEACDDGGTASGDGCSATCTVETGYSCTGAKPSACAPLCGNSSVTAPETCDDGNLLNGDGCDGACTTEVVVAEVEPNGTTAQADTNAAAGLAITGPSTMISGAITPTLDKDIFKMVLAANGVVHFETFDASGNECTAANIAAAMKLTLLSSAGTSLYVDSATRGIGLCSAITANLTAGTYYVQVEKSTAGTIAAYKLQVKVQTSKGSELENNSLLATSNGLPGSDVYVFGGHQVATDIDVFALNIPAGKSIRAEVIEGSGAETCESNGIDSLLRLVSPAGVSLGSVDDVGRGYCSLIDGTGAAAVNSFAKGLAAGTYYLQVEPSTLCSGASCQFDYRLVVTVR